MEVMKSNSRRNARVYCGMPGRAEGPNGTVRGVVRNLSRGGMFFLTPTVMPVGKTMDLQIDLPGPKPTVVTGEVRYSFKYNDGQGIGIRFVRLGAEDLASISKFVDTRVGQARI
jgi:uncharacterized protein (TIGR02266 family)